ncbi:FAD-dependent oxidoreductase [Sphingobacterium olei]|uniref:FAD-dependent oxidoreductase n=1 Tax=Sphingobacterium olei TaxID=2571155 RepID=A0A4U0NKW9_9SPHI|nr:FAD-dependent oxidoreductase [Sphingobacterium olei]TJZ54773.1 FAD-dependent oxidoreductase [Sphingobacterium olei]
MKYYIILFMISCSTVLQIFAASPDHLKVDLCIYGSTSAGVIAAYTAAKAGKTVLLVDPGYRLGGLSSGGLGMTDIGNKYVVTGLALDFYRKIGKHYNTFEQWIFEPHVAERIFRDYMTNCKAGQLMGYQLESVTKVGQKISSITVVGSQLSPVPAKTIEASIYMDCSYEGDLLAEAGVSYHVGREANDTYGETLNGVQLMKGHQFPDGIDPYVIKGDPSSGLLWGINNEELKPDGTGDKKVQAYNFRITLTNDPANRITITKPDNYDPKRYELLIRQKESQPWKGLNDVFIWSQMPNNKTDINNRNGMSTDMIGANWEYPEATPQKRKNIVKEHEDYTKGLLYFVGNDPRIPAFIREEMQRWGYPKDEYVENGHWSPQLYIREARRMVADVVMTQHHCQGREIVTDDIGYAAYTMDSHNCDRVVVNGMVKNEGNVEVGGFLPFPISYRAIVPKQEEVSNLLVPVCLSASHIAFGSIRMEPVFMVLAQAAAIAACQAIDQDIAVQDVNVALLKQQLKDNPKADFRTADELITITDQEQISLKGKWDTGTGSGYGMSYLQADGPNANEAVFKPTNRLQSGTYRVYTYYPKTTESAASIKLKIFDGKALSEKTLDLAQVEIKGQTSSTWVEIGEFTFDTANHFPYVSISTEGVEGTVAANAMLFVPIDDQKLMQ